MSVGSYSRGTALLRADIDRAVVASGVEARVDRQAHSDERARLLTRIRTLEADQRRAVRCIRAMEASRTAEREAHAESVASLQLRLRQALDLWAQHERRWRFVSRIVRDLCTPEQVRRWYEENQE